MRTEKNEPLSPEQRAEYLAKRDELRRSVADTERDLRDGRFMLLKLRFRRETLERRIARRSRKGRDVTAERAELERAGELAVACAVAMSTGESLVKRCRETLALLDAALR